MNLSRLALIADDGRLAGSVQTHLRRHLGRDVPRVALDEARIHPAEGDPSAGGLVRLDVGDHRHIGSDGADQHVAAGGFAC